MWSERGSEFERLSISAARKVRVKGLWPCLTDEAVLRRESGFELCQVQHHTRDLMAFSADSSFSLIYPV